jgi:hypothetical protein
MFPENSEENKNALYAFICFKMPESAFEAEN